MMALKVGADPEFFVGKGGKLISGFGLVPGTKVVPYKVKCGAVQVDGMALEFNIDPAETKEDFVHNIQTVLTILREMVPKDFSFEFVSVANFGWEYIEKQPVAARILGCDPDYDAYTGEQNKMPKTKSPMRTAAGHIHLGWKNSRKKIITAQHFEECQAVARQLDFFLGLPSLLVEEDSTRREMYGKAGAFRPKPYGVEYRVLSNFWLRAPSLMSWVFKYTNLAFYWLTEEGRDYFEEYGDIAKDFINSPKKAEIELFLQYDPLLCKAMHDLESAVNENI